MRFIIAMVLFVHGFAHTVGFVVPWKIASLDEAPYKTTLLRGTIDVGHWGIRVVGTLWLLAALAFFLLMAWGTETREVEWTLPFVLTLGWLVLVLSLVTVLLLLYMIRHGEATRVSSYFYLVPPLAAFQGWLFFDEPWSWSTLSGAALVIVSLLVYQSAQKTLN